MIKYEKGSWKLIHKCTACGNLESAHRHVCPACGVIGKDSEVVGRAVYRSRLFLGSVFECLEEKLC